MNLIIDIGNTRIKLGVFDGERLLRRVVWEKLELEKLQKFCQRHKIQQVALSTVAEFPQEVEQYLQSHFYFLQLNHQTPLPITNKYKTPKTLGKDRLAAVVGAYAMYPGKNCLVIDAGTCIKYDFIDAEGNYYGGNISPGVSMRLQAMHELTARLPLVKRKKNLNLVGNNTTTALQTGGQLGAAMEMEGFIRHYKAAFGKINVLLTGGDADFFVNHLKTKIFVNLNLVLCGLNKILNYNVQYLE